MQPSSCLVCCLAALLAVARVERASARSLQALAPSAALTLPPVPDQCSPMVSTASITSLGTKPSSKNHTLLANSKTVHWGYYLTALQPQAVVSSGDEIYVEMVTHHAGDDYDKMIKGDPGLEDIYKWTSTGMNMPWRGATGKGDGVHVLTGPIYVCGAMPGDVLQVDILDLEPRPNPSTGKTYGSNAAANWGYHFRAGFKDGVVREVITIYEVVKDASGTAVYAQPDYQFRYSSKYGASPADIKGYKGPTLPCIPDSGTLPGTVGAALTYTNPTQTYSGYNVTCANGNQTWSGYYYPGLITQHPTGTEDYSIRGKFRSPVNFHIGNIGVAPAWASSVDSVPPSIHGGNVDDRRAGVGATLYFPVQVAGALLSMGDAHTAMGDSELDGTGIETSINGRFRLTLHKAAALPKFVQNLTFPLLENDNEFVVRGFTYSDYLTQLPDPMNTIYSNSSLDRAMTVAYNATRDFVMNAFDLTEDQAITAITVGCDFGVTQVVDGNWGVHATVPKWMFDTREPAPYVPATVCGTSTPNEDA